MKGDLDLTGESEIGQIECFCKEAVFFAGVIVFSTLNEGS
jgi:hypothetical protein